MGEGGIAATNNMLRKPGFQLPLIVLPLLEPNEGTQCLQTSVEGARIHGLDWGVQCHQVRAQLLGLFNAMCGEGGVHRYACW